MQLSIALAVFNEEKNLANCLESVKDLASEIIVVDGSSTDRSVEIAKSYGAKVIVTDNPPIFHINKMKAVDASSGDWILQLDADEQVTPQLANEIKRVIQMSKKELDEYQKNLPRKDLFLRHQRLLEERDGTVGAKKGEYVALFIPRANYFLGRYLKYGGVYPDGVIRLFKKGKAYLPCVSVHEQYVVLGKVGWLQRDLLHFDSPTFSKYIKRNNRYTDLIATEIKQKKKGLNPIFAMDYLLIKPIWWFLLTFLRHKGFLDSWQGFIFSFFSSLRFPISYIKSWTLKK